MVIDNILDALVALGWAKSRRDAKQYIKDGAVYLNEKKFDPVTNKED